MAFTTRDLAVPPVDSQEVRAAARELEEIRQRLHRLAHHLDAEPTRALHRDVLLQKDWADRLSVELTEFAGD